MLFILAARSAETGKESKKAWKDWNGDDWNWAGMYQNLAEIHLLADQLSMFLVS